jgi:hypothetical protein
MPPVTCLHRDDFGFVPALLPRRREAFGPGRKKVAPLRQKPT